MEVSFQYRQKHSAEQQRKCFWVCRTSIFGNFSMFVVDSLFLKGTISVPVGPKMHSAPFMERNITDKRKKTNEKVKKKKNPGLYFTPPACRPIDPSLPVTRPHAWGQRPSGAPPTEATGSESLCGTIFSGWFGPVVTVTEITEHLVVFGGAR